MPAKKYRVDLTAEEQEILVGIRLVRQGYSAPSDAGAHFAQSR